MQINALLRKMKHAPAEIVLGEQSRLMMRRACNAEGAEQQTLSET